MNKYNTWYNAITERARSRTLVDYKERHHIVPKCLGGSDAKNNLVDLTAREHFICHWLLVKMHTGESKVKMIYALNGMKRNGHCTQRYETKITSRVYEHLKKEFSIVHSATMKGRPAHNKGVPATAEQKEKNRKAALGKKMSPESIAKGVAKRTGQTRTAEQKENISRSLKESLAKNPRGQMSDEHKLKRSVSLLGKPKPPGHTEKRIATLAKQIAEGTHYSQQMKSCPHCGVTASKGPYTRWHGDNCKQLLNILL
jgi:hypothetical protein